jgi:hypothetical protein
MLFVKYVFFLKKFQNSKNGMHQVGPNCNIILNFSSYLKREAVGVAQISAYAGGGGGTCPTDFFCSNVFLRIKWYKKLKFAKKKFFFGCETNTYPYFI